MNPYRWIAFLRAINVGGHTVKMEALRGLFAALGHANVATFIASGNVIFEARGEPAALEEQIERYLQQALGYEVLTFLRTPAELAAIAACRPFPADDLEAEGNSLNIAFLKAPPEETARQKLFSYRNPVDDFHITGRELYWLRRRTLGESAVAGAVLEKALGMPATVRNVTTIRKLADKYSSLMVYD